MIWIRVSNDGGSGKEVTLDVSELQGVLAKFEAADLGGAMGAVGIDFMRAVDDNFETSGHGEWPDLAESTIARRRGATYQILVDTARLRGSIRSEAEPESLEVFTDVEYAVYHVSAAAREVIPLRDFMALPEEVYEAAAMTILDAIVSSASTKAAA